MKARWNRVGAIAIVLGLALVRVAVQPRPGEPPRFSVAPAELVQVKQEVASALLDQDQLAERVKDARVLLLGEEHFTHEIVAYALGVAERLLARDERPVVLLLELPARTQPSIDAYLREGHDEDLRRVEQDEDALPYGDILRWARQHRSRVRRVIAMDENRPRIILMRALATDTRNETMAQAVLQARRDHPDARLVAYGGQLHMTLAGRYLYDASSRVPMGARLLRAGVPRGEVCTVLISGMDRFPIDDAWQTPGAVEAQHALGELPWEAYFSEPIFGAERASELFDYFVNVGPLTRVSRK